MEKGNIEIHSENIFPIIKKWLYSDRDIFIRELVSNGVDAITKLKKLISLGEIELDEPAWRVDVHCDAEAGTLTFTDNGIGMTADDVRRYINQVAFSSAEEFLARYQGGSDSDRIIGHFGLGFYSAFMVSRKVVIDTLSYEPGAAAVRWSCEGDTGYTMEDSDRSERGTTITLYLDEENGEFTNEYTVRSVLLKYCSFLPVPIYLTSTGKKDDGKAGEAPAQPEPVNDTSPLWLKAPHTCTDEEYKDFYHKVFSDYHDPIFWIHLNVDYPFTLRGILFFPKLAHQFESVEGKIKLYNNQVFVADNIKEIIPEYLLVLKGVVDCPDLPLNVSRSFLQNDKTIRRIPTHITKKVADRLMGLFKTEREQYEKYWGDIHPFIKYGCMRDDQFYDILRDALLLHESGGGYIPLGELMKESEEADAAHEEKKTDSDKQERKETRIYYANDPARQQAAMDLYKQAGLRVVVLDSPIDPHFITFLEMRGEGLRFVRVDAEMPDALKGEAAVEEDDRKLLETAFRRATGMEKLKVTVQSLKSADTPATLHLDEFLRRSQEMSLLSGGMPTDREFLASQTELALNPGNAIIAAILAAEKKGAAAENDPVCRQVYDLARLASGLMEPGEISEFISRSQTLLSRLMQKDA
ncbi:MAG: molecular chaperone HtpG [Clostridiales bacterium]|nr:molecular chaperone HtpG [Clostridiales bacterium]